MTEFDLKAPTPRNRRREPRETDLAAPARGASVWSAAPDWAIPAAERGGALSSARSDDAPVREWTPAVEMLEGEGRLIVCVELPGLAASEITIEVTDEGLILEGEKRPEPEARRGSVFRTERAYGSFRRVIPLPQGARGEEARARFENGVLKVWIPAPEVTRRRLRVPIENAPPRAAAPAWEFEGPDAALPPREVGPSPATGPALHPPGAREGHAPEPPDARPGSTGAGLASAAATVPSEGQVGTRVRG